MVLDGVTPIILVVVLGFFSAKLQMFSLSSAKELGSGPINFLRI